MLVVRTITQHLLKSKSRYKFDNQSQHFLLITCLDFGWGTYVLTVTKSADILKLASSCLSSSLSSCNSHPLVKVCIIFMNWRRWMHPTQSLDNGIKTLFFIRASISSQWRLRQKLKAVKAYWIRTSVFDKEVKRLQRTPNSSRLGWVFRYSDKTSCVCKEFY